ncbi:MAG: L-2-amino-thiazoline-4-carboxylic acid hydrolase [Oscillospiraceae bacterium]|nr:L-2-amino-thiazoline-4-carboxylic acid hydrolase [Oscillospiraceae bacterium]
MKKRSYPRNWGRLFERYCTQVLPEKKDEICKRADKEYRRLMEDLPDIGLHENSIAGSIETWFCIVAFYEASDHMIDGEAFQVVYGWHIDSLRFLGRLIDANRDRWVYSLFAKIYDRYRKQLAVHRQRGEWTEAWDVEINPENRQEGYGFHLVGCPIARHARAHGYEELLPWLCKTDHELAEVLHAKLIRIQTEILGGDCCDYWYVGDRSPALEAYRELPKI